VDAARSSIAAITSRPTSFGTRSGWDLRFTLSARAVEELLAERGLDLSCEMVRRRGLKFGLLFALNLRRHRPRPSSQWHMDEMVVSIQGSRMDLWRAVDREGENLDLLGGSCESC
jgi:putative transposase